MSDRGKTARQISKELVSEAVERLGAEADGLCPPGALVQEAEPESSPLHDLFDWDNESAGHQHRLEQARRIIRSIKIVRQTPAGPRPAPRFVSVTRVTEDSVSHGYMPTALALKGPDRASVIRDCEAQLRGLRARHGALTEFARVWDAIDDELEQPRLPLTSDREVV